MSENTLVVYYSNTGTSRTVAQLLSAQMGWPCGEIREPVSRAGATGTLRCVLDSLLRRSPAMRYEGPDPSGFASVVLVAPIWAYRMAGPMRSFVHEYGGRLRRVAVISVMGGRGASNAVAETDHILGRSPAMSLAITAREVEQGSHAARLNAFGNALREAGAADGGVRPVVLSPSAG